MIVVVSAFDETEAASTALSRSQRWVPEAAAVLRHHLLLPPDSISTAAELLEQDGWRLRPDPGDERVPFGAEPAPGENPLFAERVQKLDALHCSQESSRMAGLAQRLHGRAVGWVALQNEPG
ncbi:hypothetical protein [Saccharopolyspora gloriosae]|uniref:hypothetical protein n=1 Tax=Saccharopolyspora gloriosae TaxID=455344 RepID=UPI001FB8033A|nr:hypothetical protein [Saccharopolyspora gloriosae]